MVEIRRLRPTRRGVGVVAILVLAIGLGSATGTRSLEAVVVPGVIALLVGVLQLAHADDPTVERSDIDPGFPGESRTVLGWIHSTVPCATVESIESGGTILETARGSRAVHLGHGGQFDYTVELERRGVHSLGPARCRLTDSLGCVTATVETEETATMIVYPAVYDLDQSALAPVSDRLDVGDWTTFERLREYGPADDVRDIHWRASAKRPDDEFVVAEYGSRSASDHVTIVGETDSGGVAEPTSEATDAMASAVASLATQLPGPVGRISVIVPNGECTVSLDNTDAVFELLARTSGGECSALDRERADVRVVAGSDDVIVSAVGRRLDIDVVPDGNSHGGTRA